MSRIIQILQLYLQNFSIRRIHKTLHIDRECISQDIEKYKNLNKSISELIALENPELEVLFISGKVTDPNLRFEFIKDNFPYYQKELTRDHVTINIINFIQIKQE